MPGGSRIAGRGGRTRLLALGHEGRDTDPVASIRGSVYLLSHSREDRAEPPDMSDLEALPPLALKRPPTWGMIGLALLLFAGSLFLFLIGFSIWPTPGREHLMIGSGVLWIATLSVVLALVVWWVAILIRKLVSSRKGRDVVIGEDRPRRSLGNLAGLNPLWGVITAGACAAGGLSLFVYYSTNMTVWGVIGVALVGLSPTVFAVSARRYRPPGLRLAALAGLALPFGLICLNGDISSYPAVLSASGAALAALAAGLVLSIPVWWALWWSVSR